VAGTRPVKVKRQKSLGFEESSCMAEGEVLPMENTRDPRSRLVRERYFSLHPKPLERWLWRQELPQAAERVFWLHWEEGLRAGDWCSQISLRRVAQECRIDPSTVTRAYQQLKTLGLIRREDPGRDPHNPFQQATAITEVRLPREFLQELSGSPNRLSINRLTTHTNVPADKESRAAVASSCDTTRRPTRAEIQATWARASAAERSRYFNASRAGVATMQFDLDTQLSAEDRGQLLTQLQQMACARNSQPSEAKSVRMTGGSSASSTGLRRLSLYALARTRQRVLETVASGDAAEVVRQVVWSIEEGALRRFDPPLALNIALKKIREGAWSRPNRMPPNWSRLSAQPETCSAA
jgi:hypothetical protein